MPSGYPNKKIVRAQKKNLAEKAETAREMAKRGVSLAEGRVAKPGTLLRIMDIADMIASGTPRLEIYKVLKDKYNFDKRQSDNYYNAALQYLLPKDIEQAQEKMAAKLVTQYEALYKAALDRGSIGVARDILDSLMKLYGLTNQNKVQITENADGEKQINISFGN